jgi:hypothetical protein
MTAPEQFCLFDGASAHGGSIRPPTAEEIEAAKTPRGGWTRKRLAQWGVAWPPRAGWKRRISQSTIRWIEAVISKFGTPATPIIPAEDIGMKRYSIMVKEDGSDHEVELCQVDCNPAKIAEAVGTKMLRKSSMGRSYRTQKYKWIRIVYNDEASTVPHIRAEEPPGNAGTFPACRPVPARSEV